MDVVYVVRPGDRNDELRYSLRSLANLPHDRVWIVGYRPSWVTNVTHIVTSQGPDRHENTWRAWQAIAQHDGIADELVLFNDDMYVMHPLDQVPLLHREPLGEWVETCRAAGAQWYVRAITTVQMLERAGVDVSAGYSWELHVPMPVRRSALAEAVREAYRCGPWHSRSVIAKRTWYANVSGLVGERAEDCKIRTDHRWRKVGGEQEISNWPFLSTEDVSFGRDEVGRFIRSRFPKPSPYEADFEDSEVGEAPLRFVSVKYPDLYIPSIGVRFVDGVADVAVRGAIAYLRTPSLRRRGVMLAEEAEAAGLLPATRPSPHPDTDGTTAPDVVSPDSVPSGTAAEVLAWVGGDPARARAALVAEQARERPRSSLIARLERAARA